ncbi:1-phosphofructokinase [Lederbergia lenta]|uniref:Tagatose-6-phosphate kinase n=1 Tax=Lederbergia lenta TaxID=1467 RepID=A0A2X4WGT4_LEDLE|nr:1-phosphofructokinase [Lederbergia lenta]MCM3112164.1 1-phosphofructokinase [Lederbergia lenta]MEC2323335.1 1-phosphofructokinase [Lederbergia lenta]SQI63236.1 tagatose-6-phosphate kinase [Lederbergia lenta]
MIVTVTLNPAIDVSYRVPNFQMDQGHRVENGNKTPGGKALNVSRVLKEIGSAPLCTGFLGGQSGVWIQKQLDEQEIEHSFVTIKEETRTCLAMIDEKSGTQTELMEIGPVVKNEEIEKFKVSFQHLLKEATMVVASGSLPSGVPVSFYQEIGALTREANIPLLLDTSGEPLKFGIEGKPFLIKPNQTELSQYTGKVESTLEEMIEAAKAICSQGVQYVLLSLGAEGAVLIGEDVIWQAKVPRITAVSPVGSGDSMVAGMAYALQKKYDLDECLRWACACGLANALESTTGMVQTEIVQQYLPEIKVTAL